MVRIVVYAIRVRPIAGFDLFVQVFYFEYYTFMLF